jgi:uncharacterized protein (DUF362 family)
MKIGDIIFEQGVGEQKFKRIVRKLKLKAPVVIKPNWGFSGCFTEADILDWILSAIKGEKIVVESYGWARSEDWLKHGRMGKKTKSALRKSDYWFLDYSGIGDVLEKHDVEFMNITEEMWSERTADPNDVRELVEERYSPVAKIVEKMLKGVPQHLYDLRGGSLLSVAKVRLGNPPYDVSLAVKNLFGMIPGPGRWVPYHGKKNVNLSQSILDINKIYHSLFNISGIIEGVFSADTSLGRKEGGLLENLGIAWGAKDVVTLDAFAAVQFGREPSRIDYLRHVAETLGMWDEETVEVAHKHDLTGHLKGM